MRGALGAEAPKNEFAFTQDALAKRSRGRLWQVEPRHVLDFAATVANEVVVPHTLHVEARGTPLDSDFPD